MKILLIWIFIAMIAINCILAQDKPNVVKTSGIGRIEWFEMAESKKEAQERAEEKAKINALEKAFGTVIIQGNTTYIENVTTGEKTETSTKFNMIGNTIVKGEIIEVTKGPEFEEIVTTEKVKRKKVKHIEIECKLSVLAKEISDARIDIETFPLSKNMKNFQTTTFYDDDDFFLYFCSPVSGYITVFLDDNKYAQCLLPYVNMPAEYENGMPVEADKEYVFFSDAKEHNYFADEYYQEDTYQLVSESPKDMNRLFVIFSKEPINKPKLKNNLNSDIIEEFEKGYYSLPKALESGKFQRWLIKNQQIRSDIQVENIMITIEKKQ